MIRNDTDIENEADEFAARWYRNLSIKESKDADSINKLIEIYNKNR